MHFAWSRSFRKWANADMRKRARHLCIRLLECRCNFWSAMLPMCLLRKWCPQLLGHAQRSQGPRSGFVKPLCNRKNHNIIYPPDAKFCLCGPFPTPKDFIGPLKHLLRYLFTPLLGSQSRRRRALAESGFVKPLALRAGTASWPTRSQAARSTLCVARG